VLKPILERFLNKISVSQTNFYKDTPCWEWQSTKLKGGYGQFKINYKAVLIHRFIYEYYHGSICPDLTIDHLCRNRACCNPKHLEQVTSKENTLRGMAPSSINARKTHCKHGHEFTSENIYRSKEGFRYCRICKHNANVLDNKIRTMRRRATKYSICQKRIEKIYLN